MFDGLGIIGLIAGTKQIIKEKTEKEIPAENWNNKDLMHKDKMNPNLTWKDIQRNLKNGKYYAPEVIPERYEQPVKPIVDRARYEYDVREFGKEIADSNAKHGLYSFVLNANN